MLFVSLRRRAGSAPVLALAVLWGALAAGVCRAAEEEVDAPPPEETIEAPAAEDVGVRTNETEQAEETRESAYDEIALLTEVLLHIRKYYVEEKTYKEITLGALHGMLQALDPHSAFMEPDEYRDMRDDTSGKFSGIGIHIGMKHGVLTVIAPIEDTPGFRAGLQSGDRILEIEGERTHGITLREAVGRLRGPKGTKVVISVRGPDDDESREVEIVRDEIVVPSVKGTRIVREGVGYIRITQFAEPTAGLLQAAVESLLEEDMEALVLDLRSNPGGLLRSAVDVAQMFLEKGDLIVTTKGREGVQEEDSKTAGGSKRYLDFPVAVLINSGSASASEIVAGALQDNRRAVLVGGHTFGKGSVQSLIRMNQDKESAIRLTIAHYHTPSGRQIHDKGIEPDVRVELSSPEWRDVQLKRAHTENPGHFDEEEKKKLRDVSDCQLERAVDLLQAIRIFM
ncbi:S41 family peptidase [Verrucomicrobiota bacterium]